MDTTKNRIMDLDYMFEKIIGDLKSMHNPAESGELVCDICGKSFGLDDLPDSQFGRCFANLDRGIFWVCNDCILDLAAEKLNNIKNWDDQ